MLTSEIITDIKSFGFGDLSDAEILIPLNHAYQDLNGLESWPYLEKTLVTNFAASAAQFTATTDIKQILSLVNVAQGYDLVPMRSDDFYKQYSNVLTMTGNPLLYHCPTFNTAAPMGLTVNAWPVPPVAACQLRYLYIPVDLTAGLTPVLPARYHRALTFGALLELYAQEDNNEQSMRTQNLYDRMLARMREDLWATNYDRNDTILDVNSDDEWSYY